jgi:hypothetical protein
MNMGAANSSSSLVLSTKIYGVTTVETLFIFIRDLLSGLCGLHINQELLFNGVCSRLECRLASCLRQNYSSLQQSQSWVFRATMRHKMADGIRKYEPCRICPHHPYTLSYWTSFRGSNGRTDDRKESCGIFIRFKFDACL